MALILLIMSLFLFNFISNEGNTDITITLADTGSIVGSRVEINKWMGWGKGPP